VEERHLAKVKVAGSNPVSRFFSWRHSQVERQRSAKPLSPGSNPGAALEEKSIGGLVPNIKSAKKRVRISEERRKRNKGIKTQIKNITKKVKEEKDPKKAEELLKTAYSIVDKAVKKGVLHKNTAARRKARFTRLVKAK
jgi:small subunit ribosomal protein S20